MFRPSSVSTRIREMTRLRYHLRSAGTTYHGAHGVLVFESIASNAAR